MANLLEFNGKVMSFKRIIVYIFGLWIMTLGIALAVNSNFGVFPVTTLPYVVCRILGITVGYGTMVAYAVYIFLQIFIYRKEFKFLSILQFPCAIMFGYFTDFCKWLTEPMIQATYGAALAADGTATAISVVWQVAWCCIGVFLVALGLRGYLTADIIAIPPDALVVAFAWATKKHLGVCKRAFDCVSCGLAVILSLAVMHDYKGLWFGTLIAALGVGTLLKPITKIILEPLEKFLYVAPAPVLKKAGQMP
jgi:uncharacterized membrane protein YczE